MALEVTTTDIARFIAAENADQESILEKVLVRQVNPTLYACQVWRVGDTEPESYFINISDQAD